MKKTIIQVILGASSMACLANDIYFGPEVFVLDLNTQFEKVRVKGDKCFIGLKLGYEYVRSQAFYFGIDLSSAWGNKSFHDSYKGYDLPRSQADTGFGHVEMRFGYTLRSLITPYFGVGAYSFRYGSDQHHFEESFSYLAGGLNYTREISPGFSIGVRSKVFASVLNDEKFRFWHLKHSDHTGQWGGELSTPLIWRIARKWDVQLEPYFLKLSFSQLQNIYGLRCLFAYHF